MNKTTRNVFPASKSICLENFCFRSLAQASLRSPFYLSSILISMKGAFQSIWGTAPFNFSFLKQEKCHLISEKHFICICLQFHILIHSIPFRNKSWKTKIHGMICTSYNQWKQNVATRPSKYGLNFVKSRDLNFFKTKFQGKVS